jgi:CyaY protein
MQSRYNQRMDDEAVFDDQARDELRHIEDAFASVDPDQVEVSTSDGVLRLDLRDGTKIVINSHRAARQIWMAAIASAWHFDPGVDGAWRASKSGDELRATVTRLVRERIGLDLAL